MVKSGKPVSFEVARLLVSKGFIPANCSGMAMEELSEVPSIGILFKNTEERKPKQYLFGLIKVEQRREFVGVLYFSAKGADKQNWVFEAYGNEHHEEVKELMGEISSTFGTAITIKVVRDQTDVETLKSDWVAV